MSHPLSRTLSLATAAYGGYALARPAHLWQALQADRKDRAGLELLARTYGVRDLAISGLAIFGRSPRTVRAAMVLRIAMDLGDGALLAATTDDPEVRQKVLGVTLGWAGLNLVALTVDSARSG
jgi:predicted kinase